MYERKSWIETVSEQTESLFILVLLFIWSPGVFLQDFFFVTTALYVASWPESLNKYRHVSRIFRWFQATWITRCPLLLLDTRMPYGALSIGSKEHLDPSGACSFYNEGEAQQVRNLVHWYICTIYFSTWTLHYVVSCFSLHIPFMFYSKFSSVGYTLGLSVTTSQQNLLIPGVFLCLDYWANRRLKNHDCRSISNRDCCSVTLHCSSAIITLSLADSSSHFYFKLHSVNSVISV